jgi:hypothetical protein
MEEDESIFSPDYELIEGRNAWVEEWKEEDAKNGKKRRRRRK